MLKRLVVALLLTTAAMSAMALEYTDIYYDVNEPGWGVNLVQSNTFQFLTFYIYGTDGKPTWYTAQLTNDGTGTYTGPLFATMGTYFASPWQGYDINQAGTASFHPTDAYHAVLTYTVNGMPAVQKSIQRETLQSYPMAGDYSGAMSGSVSGCTDANLNIPEFRAMYSLQVAQTGDTAAAVTLTFVDPAHSGIACSVSGPLTHFGRLYQMANASIACTGLGLDGVARPATIDSLHPTGQGIEGKLTGQLGAGCHGTLHFAAVLNVNN